MEHGARDSSVLETVLVLWRRRKGLVLLIFPLAFAAVVSLAWALPDIYRASTTVLVEQEEESDRFVRSSGRGALEPRLQTVSQEILSRSRLEDLIERFDLYAELRRKASNEAVLTRMRRDIHLERTEVERQWGRGTTIAFTLSYQGWDPQTVAEVTNTIARMYIEENERFREREAKNITALLKEQLQDVRTKLEEQEQRVSEFKDRHIGALPEQQEANLATLERFNTQLRLNSEKQMRAMARRDRMLEERSDSTGSGNGGGDTEQRLDQLRQELAELRTQYSDKYPDVVRLKSEIATLERRLAEERRSVNVDASSPTRSKKLEEVDAELAVLKEEEKRLRGAVDIYQQRIENAPKREQELQKLMRDYNAIKALYESQLKRYEEAQLAETLEREKGEQFRILDAAIPPKDPVGPDRIGLMLMGFILCFGLTAGTVALAEQVDTSFHRASELRRFTRVPVLTSIPRIDTRGDKWRRRLRACFVTLMAAAGLLAVVKGSYLLGQGNEQLVWMLVQRGS